jgi:general secretion pathway protein C
MLFALRGPKPSTAILALTIVLSAFFMAQGTMCLIAGLLLPSARVGVSTTRLEIDRPIGADPPDAKAILARNIFDPTVGPLWPPKRTIDHSKPVPEPEPGHVCGGGLRMFASMSFTHSPESSIAALGKGGEDALLCREGARVDDKAVAQILSQSVILRSSDGSLCSVDMFGDRTAAADREMVTPALVPSGEAGIRANSRPLSATRISVQRSFVEEILQHQARFLGSVRAVPYETNGEGAGVKLFGIRSNALLAQLGLRDGDLLRSVNGFDLSDPTHALEAFAQLRSAVRLTLALVRRGQAMTLEYDLE